MSNISVANNDSYKKVCIDAVQSYESFLKFKSIPEYIQILEHTDCHCGYLYLKHIIDYKIFIEYFNKFKSNDDIGMPNRCKYVINDVDYGDISPTTLRYIKVLCDLHNLFGDLNDYDIVELGGGYGGQSKIIQDVYNVKTYQMIDLKEVEELQNKYIAHHKYKIDFIYKQMYDLFISNYAYTELCKELQEKYLNDVILKSKHGYITCNFISQNFGVDSFTKEELIDKLSILNPRILDEIPLTYGGNCIIVW